MSSRGSESGKESTYTRNEVNAEFYAKQTWELWIIFTTKFLSSLMFLIDDLTFLVFCQYEFNMTQQEAGLLFCVSAMFLFLYGLSISGYIIDRMGVRFSLVLGLFLMTLTKFMLTFVESRAHLYLLMCTISPFGISIIFPS
jgi:sugar phosphate permease